MRWQKDEVDLWCEQWASQRRKILGISPLEPKDRVGKLTSTLGAVREEGEGASQGTSTQKFPEVYIGDALLVNLAWKSMESAWRHTMEAHYVYVHDHRGDRIKARAKANALEISLPTYWKHITFSKNYVHSYVMIFTLREQSAMKVMETQKTAAFA